ncbi:gamma-glutamyltransferase family protein [Trinickia sp. LjRoot230]|uniref:gamma-glutamyltransferase family protein n=1 Tax=Trinickia sp. LjRoot230 TaxID=3342288 RepID=UPI003ECC88B4
MGQPKNASSASLRATTQFRTKEIDRPEQEEVQRPPELTFDVRHNVAVEGRDFMVASANAHATSVGYRVLEAGGTAIDALIAVQAMLTLTEPQSSSLIGGGAAITYFDHKIGQAVVIDGRETAPMAAQPDRFLGPDGRPVTFDDAVHGGRAVGVPGNLAALAVAHQINGKLPWSALLEPTIALAKRGFEISPRLAAMIAYDPILRAEPSSTVMKQYFYGDGGRGEPLPAGFVLKNPQLAEALEMIGEVGPRRAFYEGPIGKDFVETARAAHRHPSDITEEDLHVYQAKLRMPVSYRFHGPDGTKYELCSMPPPGGGTSLIEVVGVLDHIGVSTLLPNWSKQQQWTADFVHVVAQAQELALADKTHYLHDPAFRRPRKFLTERSYLRQRADLIRLDRTMDKVLPGGAAARHDARGLPPEFPSTTHITIVDKYGNAASCTSSIEDMNGSRLMSAAFGYTLNNHMSDFKLDPLENGRLVAGHVQPGARPPSSMAPTIVLTRGARSVRQFYAGLGSPGGPSIPAYAFKTITGLLLGLDPAEAAAMPNFRGLPGGLIELEEDTPVVELAPELERRGHRVSIANMNSGIHAVVRTRDGRLIGGADGRREGTVEGR